MERVKPGEPSEKKDGEQEEYDEAVVILTSIGRLWERQEEERDRLKEIVVADFERNPISSLTNENFDRVFDLMRVAQMNFGAGPLEGNLFRRCIDASNRLNEMLVKCFKDNISGNAEYSKYTNLSFGAYADEKDKAFYFTSNYEAEVESKQIHGDKFRGPKQKRFVKFKLSSDFQLTLIEDEERVEEKKKNLRDEKSGA